MNSSLLIMLLYSYFNCITIIFIYNITNTIKHNAIPTCSVFPISFVLYFFTSYSNISLYIFCRYWMYGTASHRIIYISYPTVILLNNHHKKNGQLLNLHLINKTRDINIAFNLINNANISTT